MRLLSKKTLVKRWLAALLGGKYRQTKGALRAERGKQVGYCCLGVLCNVINPKGWSDVLDAEETNGGTVKQCRTFTHGEDHSNMVLPANISKHLGIRADFEGYLIELNDGGAKFPKIAKAIERYMADGTWDDVPAHMRIGT